MHNSNIYEASEPAGAIREDAESFGNINSPTSCENATVISIDNATVLNSNQQPNEANNLENGNDASSGCSTIPNNFMTLFNEARSQFGRHAARVGTFSQQQNAREGNFLTDRASGDGLGGDRRARAAIIPQYHRENSVVDPTGASTQTSSQTPVPRTARSYWRRNLNNVLGLSTAPARETIRSLMYSGNFRYAALSTNDSAHTADSSDVNAVEPPSFLRDAIPLSSLRSSQSAQFRNPEYVEYSPTTSSSLPVSPVPMSPVQTREACVFPAVSSSNHGNGTGNRNNQSPNDPPNRNADPYDNGITVDEENLISDMLSRITWHFTRYLPFIAIILVKFVHDHFLGLLDLVLLHCILHVVNKSLCEQIAKYSHRSLGVLVRDFGLIAFVILYRLMLSTASPELFGLLIPPPPEHITLEMTTYHKGASEIGDEKNASTNSLDNVIKSASIALGNYLAQLTATVATPTAATTVATEDSVSVIRSYSLTVLIYYVAVNDLVLKLLTILIKIVITMLPVKSIRFKARARLYVVIELSSQFYRTIVPIHQWLIYLYGTYPGLEVISGGLFCVMYVCAKCFEILERFKWLKRAVINFLLNVEWEREPSRSELDAVGPTCPICHDVFNAPIIINCGHIFCDVCVKTWFKREQTCPMCRAEVGEDRTWQDGQTSFFYQLC